METRKNIVEISVDQLPELRDLYKKDWPLHIATYSTIQVYLDKAKKLQSLKKIHFVSFEGFWRKSGAFVMQDENRVYFNTLEDFPFDGLKRLLLLIEFSDAIALINIRDLLRPLIFDLIRFHHFEVISDIGTKSFFLSKEMLRNLEIK